MARETEQLLAVANHYLAEAKQVLKTDPKLASMTIGEITRNHRTRSLSPAEILLAHLASAAIRLSTICEITNYGLTENYRKKFYEKSGNRKNSWPLSKIKAHISAKPYEHLHLLLRDNVAHEEPGIANKRQIAKDRVAVLKETSIETCNNALTDIARAVKKWL
jgi:hypothetical protein